MSSPWFLLQLISTRLYSIRFRICWIWHSIRFHTIRVHSIRFRICWIWHSIRFYSIRVHSIRFRICWKWILSDSGFAESGFYQIPDLHIFPFLSDSVRIRVSHPHICCPWSFHSYFSVSSKSIPWCRAVAQGTFVVIDLSMHTFPMYHHYVHYIMLCSQRATVKQYCRHHLGEICEKCAWKGSRTTSAVIALWLCCRNHTMLFTWNLCMTRSRSTNVPCVTTHHQGMIKLWLNC
jgi:hypothetical protein